MSFPARPRWPQRIYGAYAALAFALVIVPLCLLIILGPTLAIRRAIGRAGVRLAMVLIGSPLSVKGLDHLPPGPAVCVSNHASYLDGLVLTAALPARYSFLVQHGAATWPLVGSTIARMGVRFVNRGSPREAAASIRELLRRIQENRECFAIFPEGTFKRPPGLLRFNSGAFMIATRSGVPVVPAVIRGTRTLWPEGARWPRHSAVEIEFFAPLMPAGTDKAAERTLAETTRAVMLAHCGEPDAAPPHEEAA